MERKYLFCDKIKYYSVFFNPAFLARLFKFLFQMEYEILYKFAFKEITGIQWKMAAKSDGTGYYKTHFFYFNIKIRDPVFLFYEERWYLEISLLVYLCNVSYLQFIMNVEGTYVVSFLHTHCANFRV